VSQTSFIQRSVRVVAGGTLLVIALLAELRFGTAAWIVAKAAGIPGNAKGIGGFVNGAKALVNPALVMVAAVAPLALIAGGLVLLFGGRRGMQIIGTSLGVLLLLGSVTALID
jgi:hypothetical protein